ncbi:MAG: TadE/TadG family type IV pilus assembly protein [Gaiellaceae bacterium]
MAPERPNGETPCPRRPTGARSLLQRLRECDGQAVVELAVVLPVILILILAIVDIGKAYGYQNDETHLANEAARFAAVASCGSCPTGIISDQVKHDAPPELENGTGSIASPMSVEICYPDGFAVGNPVRATVTATYKWLPYLVSKVGLPTTVQIKASATSRIESPNPVLEATTPC